MSSRQHDFTRGDALRQLVSFSGPIMAANLLQISFQFVDSLWIGNLLGASALGAVAVSFVLVQVVLSFVIGVNNAALVILSQLTGQGNRATLERYLNAFVVVLFALAVALGALGFVFADPLLVLLGTPADILPAASAYLRITFTGMVFLFGYNFISTVLRALGDSKTPMRFVLIAVVLNAVIDPLLITWWGIEGAAIATVAAQGAAFVIGAGTVIRKRLAPVRMPSLPSLEEIKKIVTLGVPAGLQLAVISGGSAAIMSVVTGLGVHAVGGFGAAQRLDSLVMLPAQALGIAVSSMAGQNIGVRNWRRVSEITRAGLVVNLSIMVAIAAVLVLLAEPAVRLFIQDDDAVAFATTYVRIVSLCYPFLGINFVLNGVVRASGAMYQVLVLNFISFWLLRYPLTYVCTLWLGEAGMGVGIGMSFIISSIFAMLYYRFGGWRNKVLFEA